MPTNRPQGGHNLHTLPTSFVVIDLETTGYSSKRDEIIEVGALRVTNNKADGKFSALIRTCNSIPQSVTKLTGITDEMLKSNGRDICEVLNILDHMVGNYAIIAYNANFDMSFLYRAYERYLGKPLMNDFIDMLPMSRRALPSLEHYRLNDVCTALGVSNQHAHRAIHDAYAEYRCYVIMRQRLLNQYGTEEAYEASFDNRQQTKSKHHWRDRQLISATEIVPNNQPDKANPLYGMNVVFTGTMEQMSRKEAQEAVRRIGGNPQKNVTQATDYLVIGNAGYRREMAAPSTKVRKAQTNAAKGLPVQIIPEDTFLNMLRN